MKRTPLKKKSKQSDRVCKNCSKQFVFTKYPSKIKSGHTGSYCSRKCMIEYSKSNAFNFNCVICGITVYTQPAQIKYRHRKTCSIACRVKWQRCVAEKRRIELGYTKHQLDRLARYSPESISWRKAVFERDNYTCQICGIRGTYLEADHIKPFAYFPELRLSLENGRTLCRPCHNTTKIGYKKMRELYEKK